MKKLSSLISKLLLLIVILSTFTACQSKLNEFISKTAQFKYPASWNILDSISGSKLLSAKDALVFSFYSPKYGQVISVNMMQKKFSTTPTLNSFIQENMSSTESLPNYQHKFMQKIRTKIHGAIHGFTATVDDKDHYFIQSYYLVGHHGYIITTAINSAPPKDLITKIVNFLKSFKPHDTNMDLDNL